VSDFDRVASAYRWLEYLAFGTTLQRARTTHLEALAGCSRILVVGDGDGRCLARIVDAAPNARIHAVDTSARMLALAGRRLPASARSRVTLERRDVRTLQPASTPWDAIVTMFVLDCLSTEDVRRVAHALVPGLRKGGIWLFADFAVPSRGWRRVRARPWIGLPYRSFQWRTGLAVTSLPAAEAELEAAGLVPVDARERQGGMVRSVQYVRPLY